VEFSPNSSTTGKTNRHKPTADKTFHFYKADKNRWNNTKGLKKVLSANTAPAAISVIMDPEKLKGFSYCWSHGALQPLGNCLPQFLHGPQQGSCTFIQCPIGWLRDALRRV
jgi:hypothetical protein